MNKLIHTSMLLVVVLMFVGVGHSLSNYQGPQAQQCRIFGDYKAANMSEQEYQDLCVVLSTHTTTEDQ